MPPLVKPLILHTDHRIYHGLREEELIRAD